LFKTFIVGIVLGIAAAAAGLYLYPVVDQHREASIVSVAANGGNIEAFHANVPMDRIMIGAPGQSTALPAGLEWPADEMLQNVRVELFKIRDARDAVVGVAARTSASNGATEIIDWMLHLPARGSVYVNMRPESLPGGYRQGELRAGSREFNQWSGRMTERWVPNSSADEEAPAGRIELVTTFIGRQEAT